MKTSRKIVAEFSVDHRGWDIPTRIILDSNGHIWQDNAHGSNGFDGKADCGHYSAWLSDVAAEEDYVTVAASIRSHFELKPAMPLWMVAALDHGWNPPDSWNREDYE